VSRLKRGPILGIAWWKRRNVWRGSAAARAVTPWFGSVAYTRTAAPWSEMGQSSQTDALSTPRRVNDMTDSPESFLRAAEC